MHSNVFNILMNIDATMPSGSGAISVYGGRHKVSRPFPPYEGGRGVSIRPLYLIRNLLLINLFINQTHSL